MPQDEQDDEWAVSVTKDGRIFLRLPRGSEWELDIHAAERLSRALLSCVENACPRLRYRGQEPRTPVSSSGKP